MENKPRIIRLCRFYYDRGTYPSLRLQGKYMKEYGFGIGDQVTVTPVAGGKMIIEVSRTNKEMLEEQERADQKVERLIKEERKRA